MADIQVSDLSRTQDQPKATGVKPNDKKDRIARPVHVEKREEKRERFAKAMEEKEEKKSDKQDCASGPSLFSIVAAIDTNMDIDMDDESPDDPEQCVVECQEASEELPQHYDQAASPYAIFSQESVPFLQQVEPGVLPSTPEVVHTQKIFTNLVDELVKGLEVHISKEVSKVEIVLQNPPIFRGVTLVVNEFSQAKRELNIQFFNLTQPEARHLIESPANLQILQQALADKGYTLRSMVIEPTWKQENRPQRIEFEHTRQQGSPKDRQEAFRERNR